jgi:outer membrane lipoprotein-sorting protein
MKKETIISGRITLVICGFFMVTNLFSQLTGREIIQMVEDSPDGENRKSLMTMELINHRGASRERTILSYTMDLGKDSKSILFFQAPADVKGTGFLSWQYDDPDRDDDKWLYLPAMKKVRRISGSSAKNENFMGSDFTYDDMGGRNVDEDAHTLTGEETLGGARCWVVESKPLESDAVYSKTVSWIRQDALIPVKVEFYDRMGELLKTLVASDITKEAGFWTSRKLEMTDHKRNHRTLITMEKIEYNLAMNESLFTVPSLERGLIE